MVPPPPGPDPEALKLGTLSPDAPAPAPPGGRTLAAYTFTLDYVDPRGRRWSGRFTNHVLSVANACQVASIKAGLLGNRPLPSFDEDSRSLAEVLAHLTVSLIERPKWAANLGELYDDALLARLYQEVQTHEAAFRSGVDAGGGAGGGTDAAGAHSGGPAPTSGAGPG